MKRLFCQGILFALLFEAFTAECSLGTSPNLLDRTSQVKNVLEHRPSQTIQCENTPPTGPIDMTQCDYETIESVNHEIYTTLKDLVRTPFFKYIQVDLYRECPFWDDDGSCSEPGCAITSIDESQIPEQWRAKALSQVDSIEDGHHLLPGCYYRDSDFCFLDDNTGGEYFDLSLIPERYTGYSGRDARRVWRSIYEENCFGLSESNLKGGRSEVPTGLPGALVNPLAGDTYDEDTCLEKKVYYKIISGLHASISTHICFEHLNQTTGQWGPNLHCFVERIASHPERLQYMYFNTVLLLRAVARLGPYLSAYDYCSTGTHEEDIDTKRMLGKVIGISQVVGRFDETALFRGEDAMILKEEFKSHFRNVTRIMDCIGCDKCRLWGKIQTTGIATALKILFEMDDAALRPSNINLLHRSEVVALINTLHRVSESLEAVTIFRQLWSEMDAKESEDLIKAVETSTAPQPLPSGYSPFNWLEAVKIRLSDLAELCRKSTRECVSIVMRGVEAFSSAFRLSGKEHGPGRPSFEDL